MNSAEIRELVVKALLGKTVAKDKVYSPRDWPTHVDTFPVILVSAPFEKKNSLGRNAPQFNTVTTVVVDGRVVAYDMEDGPAGDAQSLAAAEALKIQIEKAVINNPELQKNIQQFVYVESQTGLDADGEGHVGQVVVHFHIEYWQGPEDFYPIDSDPLEKIVVEQKQPDGTIRTGMIIELEQ